MSARADCKNESGSTVLVLAERARQASPHLASLGAQSRTAALLAIADTLIANADIIIEENARDLAKAAIAIEKGELNKTLFQRLKLDKNKLEDLACGIRQIAALADPLNKLSLAKELDDGLELYRLSCPIGVIAVIFESRPDAMPQILSLALRTGNCLILKGGTEAENSNRILFKLMKEAMMQLGIPSDSFVLLESRQQVNELLQADQYVDLIVPRGSNALVRYIQENTRIPVLGHAEGICHVYVHEDADLDLCLKLIVDAKTQYPSACNAAETVLIHKACLTTHLAPLISALQEKKVEIRLDRPCFETLQIEIDNAGIRPADESDWKTEYSDLILSIKAVSSLEEAAEHINKYGSGHTEAMICRSKEAFERFFALVNSAGVYMNASTRFADGYRYGFGAELGISTSKLQPRGPVGLEGLLSYKYKIVSDGHCVSEYTGPQAKQFKHKDIGI